MKAIGRWIRQDWLGSGGNGEVWRAVDASGQVVALKVLHKKQSDLAYARFRDEIAGLKLAGDVAGVLKMLDSRLPEKPNGDDPAYLAMPVAEMLAKHLDGQSLEVIVGCVADVAETMTALHEREIVHRDIKPDNLFWLNDRACIGDFGLVDYPDKVALTEDGRKLGPMFYIADEMLSNPSAALGRPADVFSLAKTLWVLVSGQTYPPQGEVRPENPRDRLGEFVEHGRLAPLDLLIARCTQRDPSARPAMDDVRRELRAWLTPPKVDATKFDFGHLTRDVEAMIEPGKRANEQYRVAQELFERGAVELAAALKPLQNELTNLGLMPNPAGCGELFQHLGPTIEESEIIRQQGGVVWVQLLGHDRALWSGFRSLRLNGERARHEAAHLMTDASNHRHLATVWSDHRTAPIGSAEEAAGITELREEFSRQAVSAVERLVRGA